MISFAGPCPPVDADADDDDDADDDHEEDDDVSIAGPCPPVGSTVCNHSSAPVNRRATNFHQNDEVLDKS